MFRFPQILGIAIGLIGTATVLSLVGGRPSAEIRSGAMISECDGALREIVIQYVRGADNVLPVYRQFLPMLASETTVDVVCPDQRDFDELRSALPPLSCALRPIFTGHPMTAWSRDRWVALAPPSVGDSTTLVAPLGENGAETWPQRAGDERVAFDIARARSPEISARRSGLRFDGGDLLCDGQNVFATRAVLLRNLNSTVGSRDELIEKLEQELHRRVLLMDDCPDHHAGMFMMAAADHTMLIADPSLARKFLPSDSPILKALPGGPDFSEETQRQLDSIARCAAMGYHVARIPTFPAMDRKTYLTYVNVISEIRDGRRIVYMPVYRGADPLNDAAERVWRGIGYEVKRIDCTSTYQSFGNLHCLVNVVSRS